MQKEEKREEKINMEEEKEKKIQEEEKREEEKREEEKKEGEKERTMPRDEKRGRSKTEGLAWAWAWPAVPRTLLERSLPTQSVNMIEPYQELGAKLLGAGICTQVGLGFKSQLRPCQIVSSRTICFSSLCLGFFRHKMRLRITTTTITIISSLTGQQFERGQVMSEKHSAG